ncbi:MAG TPA: SBBP repeat-containing protein, partial [Coleofasciculaceae cyanobacterium]
AGNLLWTRQLGTETADTSFAIAGDYIYITGSSAGSFAAPNTGGPDIYVAKYDTDGNLLETTQIGTDGLDRSYDITTDEAGNVYISGYTVGNLGGINNNSERFLATTDSYVAKFDSDLKLQWITQFGTTKYDDTYGIAIDNGGNLFTTGWTQGDLYGTNAGLYDVTLAKVDNLGNLLWTRQFGTSGYDFAWDVATDSFGNVYTTGYTTGDLAEANAGFYDVFLAKYDTDGNQQWIQQIGTSGSDNAFGIDIDSNNTIYLTGFTTGDLGGVNAGGDSAGADDAFWAAFDMDGNMLEVQQFGTSGVDRAFGIDVQIPGQVYLAGFTDGSLGQANAGSFDAWISVESPSVLEYC